MKNKRFKIAVLFCGLQIMLSAVCLALSNGEYLPASMLIHGKTLYLAAPDTGRITAFDLTDPQVPKPKAVFQTSGAPCSLVIEGTRLYAVDTLELFIFDIAEPGTLKLVSRKKYSSDPVSGPVAVYIQQGDIWLAKRLDGVFVNDEPAAGLYTRCFAQAKNGRLFAAGPRSLRSVDRSADVLEIPVLQGTPVAMAFEEDDLYMALGYHGVAVFRNIAYLCSVWETGTVRRNTGAFRRVEHAKGGGILWKPDVLSMEEAGPLGIFSRPDTFVSGMAFDGIPARYLYLAAGGSGVITADIADPSGIRYAASCAELTGHCCTSLILKNRILYVYEPGYGIQVVDASDPLSLKLVRPNTVKQKSRGI